MRIENHFSGQSTNEARLVEFHATATSVLNARISSQAKTEGLVYLLGLRFEQLKRGASVLVCPTCRRPFAFDPAQSGPRRTYCTTTCQNTGKGRKRRERLKRAHA